MNNIPIEILSRYYSRLYTANSSFHRNINKDLGLNKKDNYLSFIKILYEGVIIYYIEDQKYLMMK